MGVVMTELALDTLYISPYNVRRDPGDLEEIAASVKDVGILEPILVRQKGDSFEVIAGSRRVQAAQHAGHPTIPAIVLAGTDLEMLFASLIENIHRKDLTLAERVKTYHRLQELDPAYRSHRSLAKAIGMSHQKISQDFQAYDVLVKLEPFGIRVASDLPPTALERQQGIVLPEYHAVLLYQAMSYLGEAGVIPEGDADEELSKLARLIAELSQDAAKATLEEVKAGGELAAHLFHVKAGRHGSSRRSTAKQGADGGLVTCACCNRVLTLTHRADGTHTVTDMPLTGQSPLPAPAFPAEPTAAALNPAPTTSDKALVLAASGTLQPILKRTAGYTITSFPKGLNTVLTPQTAGFWGKLSDSPANPDFTETDIPQSIWTADPWIGCLWGLS